MNKQRIVIASILKPVAEPRAFNKLALSLCETNQYQLNIIGYCSKKTPEVKDLTFTSIFCRPRTHILRAWAPVRFLRELFRFRPKLVIVTTYELLPMALLGKLFLGFRLLYDLQENYHQNLLLNPTVPNGIRQIMALGIQGIERISHPFINHYFFAEQIYHSQFPYISNYTLLENKYAGPASLERNRLPEGPTFIISGTITPVYGVEKAVQWFLAIQQEFPDISLQIIGHVPLRSFQKTLEKTAALNPSIGLHLSSNPIAYTTILEAVQQARIVLMPYEVPDSIRFKIPSKLYESIALQKPIMISKNPPWEKVIDDYPAGLAIDFSKTEQAASHYKKLLSLPLYQKKPGKEVTWEGEKLRLKKIISDFLG